MAQYQIENTRSGIILGIYEGATEAEALDAMARDAGYRDYADACEVAPPQRLAKSKTDIVVTRVS